MALGRWVVADPAICHGRLTFRGTRIFVADVLEQVATGMAWDAIIDEWHGALTKEAIGEAVRLAREALLTHQDDLVHDAAAGQALPSLLCYHNVEGQAYERHRHRRTCPGNAAPVAGP